MREYTVRVKPFDLIAILTLDIHKEINRHGSMTIEGYIKDEDEEAYLTLLQTDCRVLVEAAGGAGESEILFWGPVRNFELGVDNDQKKLKLEVVSGSWLMDRKRHIRTFQNSRQTYLEITKQILREYVGGNVIDTASVNIPTEGFVLQYRETDWEFLTRLVSGASTFLTPECLRDGVKLYIGLPARDTVILVDDMHYRMFQEMEERDGSVSKCMGYTVSMRDIYPMGTRFLIAGQAMSVYRIESRYLGGEMLHVYYARRGEDLPTQRRPLYGAQGASLAGLVMDVKEDRVKIRFLQDENRSGISDTWFPFSTVYATDTGTGWYWMPEIGEQVRLYIPGWDEREAYAASAVYGEAGREGRMHPDHKILKTAHGKEIRFTPDEIVITNNQGLRIELLDNEGIRIVSNRSIAIEAGEDMTISSGKGSIAVAADDALILKQQGTEISLQDGVRFAGGEFRIQ